MRHRAVDIGAEWLTDKAALINLWDKELDFEVEITNIVLDKLTS